MNTKSLILAILTMPAALAAAAGPPEIKVGTEPAIAHESTADVEDANAETRLVAAKDLFSVVSDAGAEPSKRQEAADALGEVAGADIVDDLLDMWFESDTQGKGFAQQILQALVERSPEAAVPALIPRLRDPQLPIRAFVADQLGSMDLAATNVGSEAASVLLEIVKSTDDNPIVREAAVTALGRQTGLAPEVAKNVVSALVEVAGRTDEPEIVRVSAAAALGELAGAESVGELLDMWFESDTEGKGFAQQILQAMAKRSPETAVPALVSQLNDVRPTVRLFILTEFGSMNLADTDIGSAAALALLKIVESKDDNPVIRAAAAMALGKHSGLAPSVAKEIVSALRQVAASDDEVVVREAAVTAVGGIAGADAAKAEDAIWALLQIATSEEDDDESVRGFARAALQDLLQRSPETAVPVLITHLYDRQPLIRVLVVTELGSIDPAAEVAVSAATTALLEVVRQVPSNDDGKVVRSDAAMALTDLAKAEQVPAVIVPEFMEMSAIESDPEGQQLAKRILDNLPATPAAISALLAVLNSGAATSKSRKLAAAALAELVDKVPEEQLKSAGEFSGLLSLIKDDSDPKLRTSAALTLRTFLGAAPEDQLTERVADELISIVEDETENLSVRSATTGALGQLIARVPSPTNTEKLSDLLLSLKQKEQERSIVFKKYILDELVPHLSEADSKDLKRLADVLAMLGQPAIESLSEQYKANKLEDEDELKRAKFRSRIVGALGAFRHKDDPKLAIPKLFSVLKDKKQNVNLRIAAAEGIVALGKQLDRDGTTDDEQVKDVVTRTARQLLPVVEDGSDDSVVREFAAEALASLPLAILDELLDELKKLELDKKRREYREALLVLARICVKEDVGGGVPDERLVEILPYIRTAAQEHELSKKAAESLIRRLIDKPEVLDEDEIQTVLAAHGGEEAVSLLQEKFRTSKQRRIVDALLSIMMQEEFEQDAKDALKNLDAQFVTEHLLSILAPSNVEDEVPPRQRWKIALVLCEIVDPQLPKHRKLPAEQRRAVLASLVNVLALDSGTDDEKRVLATTIKELRKELERDLLWARISLLGLGLAAYVGLCLGFWAIVYRRRPLAVFRFNQYLSKSPALRRVLRPLLFVWVFEYRDGVLDAWVADHIESVREAFGKLPTVQDRSIHVPTPVEFEPVSGDKSTLPELSPQLLRETFSQNPARLLLLADGGSGKTSLACQIAKWAMSASASERLGDHCMLPVLVEQELREASFHDTILERLTALTGDEVPQELFEHLLKRRRVLVIFDRFSEMDDDTQELVAKVLPRDAARSVGSLLVTSRNKKGLEACEWTMIKPLFIQGNRLSSFMERYLAKQDQRTLFDDAEFFELCRRLSLMVGEREITALFGKLYADELISAKKDHRDAIVSGPDSIPSLMKTALKREYSKQPDGPSKIEDTEIEQVQQASQKVAWVCLRGSFRPGTISQEDALEALDNEEELLAHLVDDRGSEGEHLRSGTSRSEDGDNSRQKGLLQRVGRNRDHLRFILDPVAEYFAGLHLVETECGSDAKRWLDFLKDAEINNPEKTRGFLLAVRDCCLATDVNVPDRVPDELAKLAGLSIRELEQHQREQRIHRNVANLDLPAPEDRVAAAEALGSIGVEAEKAVPALVLSLRDQESSVRAASVEALGRISSDPGKVVPELGRLLTEEKQSEVLRMTVKTLGEFGADSKEFIPQLRFILRSRDNKLVREAAVTALGRIGREVKEVIPDLITVLSDDDWDVAEKASKALGRIGPEAVTDLARVLTHTDELARWRAAEALAAIGPSAKDAVPGLIHALEDEDDWSVRKSAAVALGRIGPAAIDAVDVLQKTEREDEEPSVASAAEDALRRICPEMELEKGGAEIGTSKNKVS